MRLRASWFAALLIVLGSVAERTGAAEVWKDATAVWHLGQPSGDVTTHGAVQLGVALPEAEQQASRERGGDGRVARFEGGYLTLGPSGSQAVQLQGKAMTLAVRLRLAEAGQNLPLLAKDAADDRFGQLLFARDEKLHYRWRTTPAGERVNDPANYGFNGESNDCHHLGTYQPGQFALSTMTVEPNGNVTLFHNGFKATGQIDPGVQNLGAEGLRIGGKRDDCEFLDGEIAEILVYRRVLSEAERRAIEASLNSKWQLAGSVQSQAALPSSDLVLHLDASQLPAGPLAAWKNLAGTGQCTQADAARQPTVILNALGGKPVVRFAGRQCLDGPAVLPAGCKALSMVAVWKRNHAQGSQVVVEQSSPGRGRRACLLTIGSSGGSRSQEFLDGVLGLSVPWKMIDPTRWHDVVVRFRGANLEMFVDGVLVDEEWPHGPLDEFRGPFLLGAGYENGQLSSGFRGEVDHVVLWERALEDDEITQLSGGADEVVRRDLEILGPVQESLQYWKPRGQAFAGDCIPFYHDGTFHLFYLFDRRHHGSKWGLGAHQYAHASTTDLIHWTHHPKTVPITEPWESSIGTCNVIFNPNDQTYYAFYTDCGGRAEFREKPQRGNWIYAAQSRDGIHFSKNLKPLVPGHDCTVFCDPATGLFHLIRGNCTHLVSQDLANWEEVPGNFVERQPGTSEECPNHFEWNGWYYFILGTNALWKSRTALGPWEPIAPNVYDGLFVPKVAEFTGNRRLLAGFLTYPGWAGHIAMRELVQKPDGTLGLKFIPEMIPPSGEPVQPSFAALNAGATGTSSQVQLTAADQPVRALLAGVPKNVRITLQVVPQPGVKRFGLCLRGAGEYASGSELRFEPERARVQIGTVVNGQPAPDATAPICQGRDFALENVEGLDRPLTLDIIIKDNLLDVSIDQRRTLISRRDPEPAGDRLFFFAHQGAVVFKEITVRPLKE